MLKKKTILLVYLSIFILLAFLFILFYSNKDDDQFRPRIAVCPTFFPYLESKLKDQVDIIKTTSTAHSLSLLTQGKVDHVLAGRPLKPAENNYQQVFLDINSGLSFVASLESSYYLNDLKDMPIYTNLEIDEIKKDLALNNLIFIEDIYTRPEPSLAITNWINTDYSRAPIVHILNTDDSRYLLSRTPVLLCTVCEKEIINLFNNN
jgi:hypothetical protein